MLLEGAIPFLWGSLPSSRRQPSAHERWATVPGMKLARLALIRIGDHLLKESVPYRASVGTANARTALL